ncbi:cyclic-phosphate processing receiver domain-containing protein [Bacillus pseudomycoides]|uniref:cyclic-phosphate processing receiver domain-containing protein n=1 Tax=Bacillus pseudomycoides TaxID=64104 RepID=UPI001FB233FE|nr:cyclic-phosphate processing receiver domain-containing protein [Bacillus pseudomycoides]
MNVYMDDQRLCPFGYSLVTTVEDALKIVKNHDVRILSLDYNMGWRRKNGLDFLEIFCKEGLYAQEIHLHTNDSIGMQNMLDRINKGKEAREISSNIQVKCTGS